MRSALPGPRRRARSVSGLSLLLVAASVLVGCASDAPVPAGTAYDYQGFWLVTSWTMDFGDGVETLVRGGAPTGLLGDALVAATSASAATLSLRYASVVDEVPMAAPARADGTVLVEVDRWVVSSENDPLDPLDDTVRVYRVALDAGVMTLDVDPSDPRHDGSDGPLQLVLERQTPWGTTATGTWQVTSVDFGAGWEDPGVCAMSAPSEWARSSIDVAIDDRWMHSQSSVTDLYDANGCPGAPIGTTESALVGYAEEEGTELRLWVYDAADAAGSGHVVFTLAPSAPDVTLTRTACTPASLCAAWPLGLVLGPPP